LELEPTVKFKEPQGPPLSHPEGLREVNPQLLQVKGMIYKARGWYARPGHDI